MASLQRLRLLLIVTLVVLTVQGWTGDYVNLFAAVPSGGVSHSFGGILSALSDSGDITVYHAFEGALLVVLSLVVVGLSFKSKTRSLLILSIVAAAAVISAAVGGLLFVLSAFQNNANSAQMAGSFIGAYAFYFIELYFTKET
jgi:hypothetical protein